MGMQKLISAIDSFIGVRFRLESRLGIIIMLLSYKIASERTIVLGEIVAAIAKTQSSMHTALLQLISYGLTIVS